MYKVVEYFIDLKDNNHEYNVGDTYPREGLEPTDERKAELAGRDNKRGIPLIEKAEEPVEEALEEPVEEPVEEALEEPAEKKPAKKKAEKTADK